MASHLGEQRRVELEVNLNPNPNPRLRLRERSPETHAGGEAACGDAPSPTSPGLTRLAHLARLATAPPSAPPLSTMGALRA